MPTAVTVYLVGAGPGDPGLLTVAGVEALRRADVVVYDYLANKRLLDLAPARAERVYVGKSAGAHTLTQEEINQLLVDKARALEGPGVRGQGPEREGLTLGPWPLTPRVVVRLKGGDPYVFGRGGEEAETLRAAGIPFVVIPGITSGIAAANYAGIPVTHRDFATTLTLVTGHEREGLGVRGQGSGVRGEGSGVRGEGSGVRGEGLGVRGEGLEEGASDRVNYPALAALGATGTLVFYMGVKALPSITAKLIAAGLDPQTPGAVIRWGTHPHQRTVTATVATLAETVAQAGITAPAITLIGKVVSLRDTLNWFEERPLFGQTILVTRTRQQASDLSAALLELGANVLEAPTIDLAEPEDWAPIDEALLHIPAYDWIVFTSANGVRAAWDRLRHLDFDARHFAASDIAAIGPATAEELNKIGLYPDLIPEKFVGEELAAALQKLGEVKGKRFLLLRADIARPVLREELQKAGAVVDDVAIYRTVRPAGLPEEVVAALREGAVDWMTFTSASTATNLFELLPAEVRDKAAAVKKASIGPITSAALRQAGWEVTVEAGVHDIAGLVGALRQQAAGRRSTDYTD